MRLSAIVMVLVLVGAEWLLEGVLPAVSFFSSSLLGGSVVLTVIPLCSEDLITGKWVGALSLAAVFSAYFTAREFGLSCSVAILAVSSLTLAGFYIYRTIRKFRSTRQLFQAEAVWTSVDEYFRFFYSLFLMVTAVLLALSYGSGPCLPADLLLMCLSLALFILIWLRARSGRTMFLGRRKERLIREMVNAGTRMTLPDSPEDEARMNSTYNRLLALMNDKRPYLKDTYYISDLCNDLGVNKSYISNVISVYSGRNYRQFINYYRIKYATKLMKENPSGLIMETALLCGFHSVVSFNMAFRLNLHMTPSEYLARIRGQEDPSRTGEEDS